MALSFKGQLKKLRDLAVNAAAGGGGNAWSGGTGGSGGTAVGSSSNSGLYIGPYVEPGIGAWEHEAGAAGGGGGAAAWSSRNSGQYAEPGRHPAPVYAAGAPGDGGGAAAWSSRNRGHYVEPERETTPAYAAASGASGGGGGAAEWSSSSRTQYVKPAIGAVPASETPVEPGREAPPAYAAGTAGGGGGSGNIEQYVEPGREAGLAYARGGGGAVAPSSSNSGQYVEPGREARPADAAGPAGGGEGSSSSGQYVEPGREAGSADSSGAAGGSDFTMNIDDAARLLLRFNADAFFRAMSAEQKALIENDFVELGAGAQGLRGRMTLAPLLKILRTVPESYNLNLDAVAKLFLFLDAPSPTGSLSFPDYLVISQFVVSYGGVRLCSSCASLVLPMLGFTCGICWGQAPSTFDLCFPCFSSRRFSSHPHSDPTTFVDLGGLMYASVLNKNKAKAPISSNTNAAATGLQSAEELQLFHMRLQHSRQLAQMMANTMANTGAAISNLASPSSCTYTYIERPYF
ncbi:hypothetical protein GOP47_0028475 [Adiantum capillus-veneris]|nr:hypothetical protein GOP47_0028475 [Adiantum capillus-veneris]